MTHTNEEQALALAGVVQACHLVDQVAYRSIADSAAMEASLQSLFAFDAPTVAEVYGGKSRMCSGLRHLRELLTRPTNRDSQVARYVLSILHLERKLNRRHDLLNQIRRRLDQAEHQVRHFSLLHGTVLANLADIYVNTVSTIPPKILVKGEPNYLANPENVNRIRALLLAAIRSAVLWRQCGGNRLQLLFGRRKLLLSIEQLLRATQH